MIPQSGKIIQQKKIIQPKLKVNQPGDSYEQEADSMADKVMRMTEVNQNQPVSKPVTGLIGRSVQRKCAKCEEEEKKLMRKEQSGVNGGTVPSSFSSSLNNSGNGMPLHAAVKEKMEHAFNTDFSAVRIHTGQQASELNNDIHARAFTYGNDIYFNKGQYAADTYEGKKLLAHELTHVVQQNNMGIQRKIMPKRIGNDTVEFEEKGNRYRVTRTAIPVTVKSTEAIPPSVTGGIDESDIFLEISWCRDNIKGDIKLGADVPEQVKSTLEEIMTQIKNGAGADKVREILEDTEITPFISATIAKSGAWEIEGALKMTVGKDGVKSVGVEAGIPLPTDKTIIVDVEYGNGGLGVKLGLEGKFGSAPKTFKCPVEEKVRIRYLRRYKCEQWQKKMVNTTKEVPVTDRDARYIYFDYANAKVDETRSKNELEALESRLKQGYRVAGITGFTSPEGPKEQRKGSKFIGNDQLSNDRATAALHRVENIIQALNLAGNAVAGVDTKVIPLGDSELYTLDRTTPGGKTVEVEGAALEQHAEQEFMTHSEEDRHKEEAVAKLQTARTPQQRADIIYPLLRRAVVTLTRDRIETQPDKKEVEGFFEIPCNTIPNFESHTFNFRMDDMLKVQKLKPAK